MSIGGSNLTQKTTNKQTKTPKSKPNQNKTKTKKTNKKSKNKKPRALTNFHLAKSTLPCRIPSKKVRAICNQ